MKLTFVDPYSPATEEIWRDLEAASAPPYFLSWGWIECWLACLPRGEAPPLAVVEAGGAPIAAFFLGRKLVVRHGVLPSRALYLNVTGTARFDELWIEYNGLIGTAPPLAELVALLPGGWDELYLPALAAQAFGGADVERDVRVRIERTVPTFHVELDRVRDKDYLSLLSGQTRSQVRRAQREAGPCTVEVARDLREAMDIYSELVLLHTAQWQAKGKPGAFADPWFDRFHRRLIMQRFARGEIQLLRVRGEKTGTIGCLYNQVFRGRVLQYQSGMATFDNAHLKPGFVCHAAAIEHAAGVGLATYDFLGGDMRYKRSLSTGSSSLWWARVQRRRVRFLLEDQLRNWRDRRASATAARP